jgi:hypothetical protein
MLHSRIILFALAMVAVPSTADARLFWQTYGATVASADGCGCAWNINQDYFVPRHCGTGRYGLFSACKSAHTISPACKNMHPLYAGYCTPYGSCRYKWRDHVYKTYCGCGPLKNHYGPWHLKPSCKHSLGSKHACGDDPCLSGSRTNDHGLRVTAVEPGRLWLCNVEPFGGEILGTISALTVGPTSPTGAGPIPTPSAQPLPPKLNLTPNALPGGSLPAPFSF